MADSNAKSSMGPPVNPSLINYLTVEMFAGILSELQRLSEINSWESGGARKCEQADMYTNIIVWRRITGRQIRVSGRGREAYWVRILLCSIVSSSSDIIFNILMWWQCAVMTTVLFAVCCTIQFPWNTSYCRLSSCMVGLHCAGTGLLGLL